MKHTLYFSYLTEFLLDYISSLKKGWKQETEIIMLCRQCPFVYSQISAIEQVDDLYENRYENCTIKGKPNTVFPNLL
jgi:hypothetical protein